MLRSRPEPARFVDIGHARIPVWIDGSGPTLVFVHGWPLTGDTWSSMVDELRHDHTCVTFDLPGAGLSEWTDPARLTLDELARAVVEVVRSLPDDAPVVLVGHDSGGGLARMAAVELGERVGGMVLGNTEIPGVHSWRFRALFAAIAMPGSSLVLRLMLRTRLGRYLLMRDAVADRARYLPDMSQRFLVPLSKDERLIQGALAVVAGVRAADFDALEHVHPRITAPVRLVWGVRDPWFPLHGARAMLASFGGQAELVEVPDAGLLVHEEAPAAVASQVRAVCATAARTAA